MVSRLRTWVQALTLPGLRIETERLVLREFQLSDCFAVAGYRSDPHVLHFMERREPYTEQEVWETVFGYAEVEPTAHPRSSWDFAIIRVADRALIGETGLCRAEEPGEALLGYLLRRDAWGCGYATEAAAALVEFGFAKLELKRITAGCHPENGGSYRVMEKLGMQPADAVENFPGSPPGICAAVMTVTREEWSTARRAQSEAMAAAG